MHLSLEQTFTCCTPLQSRCSSYWRKCKASRTPSSPLCCRQFWFTKKRYFEMILFFFSWGISLVYLRKFFVMISYSMSSLTFSQFSWDLTRLSYRDQNSLTYFLTSFSIFLTRLDCYLELLRQMSQISVLKDSASSLAWCALCSFSTLNAEHMKEIAFSVPGWMYLSNDLETASRFLAYSSSMVILLLKASLNSSKCFRHSFAKSTTVMG